MKIIKNNTLYDITLHGVTIPVTEEYTIPLQDYANWAASKTLPDLITNEEVIINDGEHDLAVDVALEHMRSIHGISHIHDNIEIYPIAGQYSPALTEIGPAAIGYEFAIGDKIYANAKYDNIAGSTIFFEIHACIDNSVADRWIAFNLYSLTSNGDDETLMNGYALNATFGPFEVPTTPFKIFKMRAQLPAELFSGGEEYIFSSGTRIDVTSLGKTNPINNPIVLRVCRIYYRRGD